MNSEDNFSFHKLLGQVVRLHFCLTHKTLEKEGLYPGQPPLLYALYDEDGLSQKEIAEKLHLKPATITVMIKRLEKAGFIKKVADENDQRISRIHLTEKGISSCVDLKSMVKQIDDICLHNFTDDDINSLKILLERIQTNLKVHKENTDNKDNIT
ncbi:MarR family transcriptional regulator [Clostridium sardiniense]|uniref:MarR family transcriptional regulator n=1 Tax=Clostridium sardiniense TaxID=29369 RepID=A0ABS7KUY4_CLOSR|nr:MarR family transcriptional regulator [Clostridium sardiniense]MBY0754628.1 MarR family transcriptional regulator [Clostridium sardiniense]MDQ0460769.1 DNA-binding MarR family transcriptional regulator [Clostridium sardiniense]